MRADAWGVAEGYSRADGRWVDAPADTVEGVLAAMGASEGSAPSGAADAPLVVRRGGEPSAIEGRWRLVTEDGGEVDVDGALPPDVPLGYHTLVSAEDGARRALIVSPGRCVLPAEPAWGWALQLYAARSAESWGMGDLADLRRLGEWSAGRLGAGLVLVNPLHAALPGVPQTASPYFPSSRRFRNPLYLRVEEVPGAAAVADLDDLAAAGRALTAGDRRIDRDQVHRLKMSALEAIWERWPGDPRFDAYRRSQGEELEDYGAFCALTEEFGRSWEQWPPEYRHPGSAQVTEYRRRNASRAGLHVWLQWLVDEQLARAAAAVPLVQDLAIGVDPAGADAWLWQDVVVGEMSVGAPADEFNTKGQDWGLPPFDPWKLRAAGYGPFIRTMRAALRHAGGMRLDHVMGLFRLFWIPRGASPTEGTYVRYPASDLLDIVALESHRNRAYVVGEDLGTVEPEVREELAARQVLSYRLLWFEREAPERWPTQALAAVTTHDLPTVAGLWTGSDLEAQRQLDLEPNEEGTAATRDHLGGVAGASDETSAEDLALAAYGALARTPCLLLTATLDDAVGVEERPNMPGTTDEWPNWSIALPCTLEELERDSRPPRLAALLRRDGSATGDR
ncbi:MAG: 4-alpha-glucanotransferase [Acidimicrobiia bacterium]